MSVTYASSSKLKKFIPLIVLVVVLAIVAIDCFVVVPAGHTGVVVNLGEVRENVLQEGFHFKVPFIQEVINISNKIQKEEVVADAVSKDLQQISSSIAVNYRVGLSSSAQIYKNVGYDYAEIILLPAVQESMKAISAKYTAEELITMRSQIGTEIKTTLDEKVKGYGIVIEDFNIVNFAFSEEFNAAIEAKQVAEQNLIKTKTEQEQAIVIAEAEAQKKVIAAEAEATAILAEAEANAKANKVIAESIQNSLLEYLKLDKWDGKLPLVQGADGTIIDLGSLLEEAQTPAE
ncbi:MAG: prohibitin family protein [Ruminococcaceae bacterium]|nr:prohibitin family protein [Oscillospiraceae bacterium]